MPYGLLPTTGPKNGEVEIPAELRHARRLEAPAVVLLLDHHHHGAVSAHLRQQRPGRTLEGEHDARQAGPRGISRRRSARIAGRTRCDQPRAEPLRHRDRRRCKAILERPGRVAQLVLDPDVAEAERRHRQTAACRLRRAYTASAARAGRNASQRHSERGLAGTASRLALAPAPRRKRPSGSTRCSAPRRPRRACCVDQQGSGSHNARRRANWVSASRGSPGSERAGQVRNLVQTTKATSV